MPELCSISRRFTHGGAPSSRFFWKKTWPGCVCRADAVHPSLAGEGAIAGVGDEDVRDAGVVVEDVGLRRARLRVEHLVQVGQLQPVAVHAHQLAGSGLLGHPCLRSPRLWTFTLEVSPPNYLSASDQGNTGRMRSIWKGAITFGLVNVPVKLYSATEDHDVAMHQVHDKDGGRIRYQRRCEIDGEIVDYEHIDKAYDDGGRTVVITAEDLKSLPVEQSREIDVVEFVPTDQVDPIMFEKAYYLEPDSKSSKAYVLLRRTLEETDRTAIVKFALRQKTRLAALRVRDDVLVLQTLLWGDEVREAKFPALDEHVNISEKELKMSASLVKSFESDFTPEDFTDDYQEQLQAAHRRQARAGGVHRHRGDLRPVG